MPGLARKEIDLHVKSDALTLVGGACLPADPRAVAVLLHGIPSAAPPEPGDEGYPGLARAFASAGHIAVWVQMRGVGGSPGYFSIEGWVRDAAAAVAAATELDGATGLPVAVVGSSAGGAVGAEAIRRGVAATCLALLGTPAAWLGFAADPPAGVRRILDEAGMPLAPEALADPAAWAAEFERVTASAALTELDIPVLVVHGTADDVVPVDHARMLSEAARDAELVILDGAAHQLRRDDRAVEVVLAWMDRRLP